MSIQVGGVVVSIAEVLLPVGLIGSSVLLVMASLASINYLKSVLGYSEPSSSGDVIPPAPGESDTVTTAEDFQAMYATNFRAPSDSAMTSLDEFHAQFGGSFQAPSDSAVTNASEFDAQFNPRF